MKQLSIVTYNILAEAYVKPSRYPRSTSEALDPAARRRRLLDQVSGLSADIICLQEVEPDAFELLDAQLKDYQGHFAPRLRAPDGLAIFSRITPNRITPSRIEPLRNAELPGGNELIALVGYFDQGLAVACTHLRWQAAETPLAEHIGLKQLNQLMDHLDGEAGRYPARVLAGDFNANSQSALIEAAQARGYALSCRSQRPWDTTNINGRRRKLDYLLHTPERLRPSPGKLPRLERDTPMPSLKYPSDHLPVQVLFGLAS